MSLYCFIGEEALPSFLATRKYYLFSNRKLLEMGTFLLPLVLLVMFAPGAWAQAVADPDVFLNINCGEARDMVDPGTNLFWHGDEEYVDFTGYPDVIAGDSTYGPQVSSLRFFNDSGVSKYCYRMPVTSNTTYMVRASFFHGGYDPSPMPSFRMSLDGLVVANISARDSSLNTSYYFEYTYQAQGNATFLCLLRDETNTIPYISAIILRRIKPYPTMLEKHLSKGYVVMTRRRYNLGESLEYLRYPNDIYDRYWQHEMQPTIVSATSPLSNQKTSRSILYAPSNPLYDTVPMVLLQSALTSAGTITFTLPHLPVTKGFLFFHFAEINSSLDATSREFTVKPSSADITTVNIRKTDGLDGTGVFWDDLVFEDTRIETVVFAPVPGSVYGPLINGLELFDIVDKPFPAKTVNHDAFAIEHIKSSLKLARWTGDPCVPVPHSWVVCTSPGPPTIETVNVSKFGLSGPIPMEFNELPKLTTLILSGNNFEGRLTDLSLLENLQTLHLQDNNLTGPLPAWLGQLPRLKELYVQGNDFQGSIPSSLLSKNGLDFKYLPGNPSLVVGSAPEKKTNIWVIVGPVLAVGLVAILAAAAVTIYCCVCKKRPGSKLPVAQAQAPLLVELGESRTPKSGGALTSFSVAAIAAATQNFKREIGKGGFGPVYYGQLPSGEQVAVKVLDRSANTRVAAQFFNEVDVLSKVHHKNLVSLLGFCNEGENRMLVYEYLPQGSLRDRLNASPRLGVLDFKARLSIALNAAQGLDYLHTGCNPGIVHRDVKSTNILLTGTTDAAKVGDFGLSRLAPMDADNGSMTIIQGTRGYIDPEYVISNFLTTKSDVYSFGVVLLELLTGSLPLPSSSASFANHAAWTLCDWVRTTLQSGADGTQILDPDLRAAAPNAEAVWVVADLAMRCVEPKSVHRPFMTEVVHELRMALALEVNGPSSYAETDNSPTTSLELFQGPVQQQSDDFSAVDMSWPAPR